MSDTFIISQPAVTVLVSQDTPTYTITATGPPGPQGPPGATGSADSVVTGETPSGTINSSNATFTSEFPFVPGTVDVQINGLGQRRGIDFTTSGTAIILMSESPLTGDALTTSYRKA